MMHAVQTGYTRRQVVAGGLTVAAAAVATTGARAERGPRLRAGAAEQVITPAPEGTFLIGPMKTSTGVHDDLHARALVLDDGETRVVLITLDHLGFDFAYTRRLIDAAARAGGLPTEHVMINCSHTHSAPLTAPWGSWKEHRSAPFFDKLPDQVAKVANTAVRNLRPATLRCAQEPVQIGFNRRRLHQGRITMAPNPTGAVVPWVDVLSIDDDAGRPVAVLFSHAAHPVIVHSASTLISGDYPAFALRTLSEKTRGATCLFAQGCCGNVNGFPLQGGIDAAKAAGRDLGQAAARALHNPASIVRRPRIRIHNQTLQLPFADPPPLAELRRLRDQETRAERKQRFTELLAIAQRPVRPTMPMPIRAFAIGDDFCLLGLPHEPFAEYHHHAVKASPFKHNMVLAYTNGLECYLGSRAAYELGDRGGYETSPRGAAFMFKDRLPLAPQSEAIVRTGVTESLHALRNA